MTTLALRRWRDPYAPFDTLFRTLTTAEPAAAFTPAADVVRDGEDAVVRLELPGLDVENDVAVEVERGVLVVKGERRDEHTEDADGRILREVRYGSFRRAFRLPSHVTEADVSATYDSGVLTVRVSGAYAGSTPKRIPVSAGGGTPEAKAA
jgi:HSP20 family protein